ncbi:MAG: acyl-CoA dehydrogenase family protein [Pseudonocardiaceae bacterium]
MRHPALRQARALDQWLGDPGDPDTICSTARILDLDDRETFPEDICSALDDWGLHHYYVPRRHGGRLTDFEELVHLVRIVARRDLTVTIGHVKTYLGGVSAWLSALEDQATGLAERILAGDQVAWALTEPAHGSDLLASEFVARPRPGGGYLVSGEKWLINNATRGGVLCLLARTDPAGGPRGFSLLLVDKRRLPTGTWSCLPAEPTVGIRGADISGVRLHDAPIPHTALLGRPGSGVETVLRGMQLTRTLCAALSLGAAEHAVRIAVDFAENRQTGHTPLTTLPGIRRQFAETFADLLLCEAITVVVARAAHTLTGEMSVLAPVVKYLVPTTTDTAVARLGKLIGARSFLLDVLDHGAFQKIARDHRIVAIFDGSTVVNLNALIAQSPLLGRGYRRGRVDRGGLDAATTLAPLPELVPARLRLTARAGSSLLNDLPDTVERVLREVNGRSEFGALSEQTSRLASVVDQLHATLAATPPRPIRVPAADFDTAHRYTLCATGAACLRLWVDNRHRDTFVDDPLWWGAAWLRSALARVLTALEGEAPPAPGTNGLDVTGGVVDEDAYESLVGELLRRCACRAPLSLLTDPRDWGQP